MTVTTSRNKHPAKKSFFRSFLFRSIQSEMIGNQRPLIGNSNRSQIATKNKNDHNCNIENANVTTNLSIVTTTTH